MGLSADDAAAAHPRVGGENAPMPTVVSCPYGSSPRRRGKREAIIPLAARPGLIPA